MNNILTKIKKFLAQLAGYFPTALPQGMEEFQTWKESIVSTYALPTRLDSDIVFVLSTEIMRLGPQKSRCPKVYFVRAIRAVAAKQVAAACFQQVKQASMEAQAKAAEESAAKTEATKLSVVSDGQKQ